MAESISGPFFAIFVKFVVKVLSFARDSQTVSTTVLAVTEDFKIFAGLLSDFFKIST